MYRSGNVHSFECGAAVTRRRFVKLDANGNIIPAAAVTDDCLGVAAEDGTTGQEVSVALINTGNIVEIEASEAIAINELVGPATDGRARDADTAGNRILGRAVTAAGGAGEVVSVLLQTQAPTV